MQGTAVGHDTAKDGKDGVGINNIEISNDGNLLITLTNGTSLNLGNIKGAKGDQGVQGEKGEKGDAGLGGADGKDGTNGVDGIGVTSSEINALGELVITYSDGNTVNLGKVVGNDGAKGDQGIQGEKGDKGDQGVQGEKADKGDQGVQGEKGDAGINGKDGTNGTDGVGVASSEINALGELVITYSDGNTVNLGKVVGNDGAQGAQGEKGEKGDKGDQGVQGEKGDAGINGTNGADGVGITDVTINADNELVLTFSNGNIINLGNIKGSKGDKGDKGDSGLNGKDGVGIQNVDVSADGALTVTLTNGTVLNLGNIKGADGLGITKAEINTSGELVLTYSNGDVKNLGKVTGENGKDGANGADGRGIKSLTLSPDGELVVTMSDNSISNLGNIKGEKGDKGDTGENGKDGITPKIRINSLTLEWEVSNDNGQTWVSLNVKAVQAGNQETVGDFVYVLLENGTYGIRASENFNSDSLEIPEKYNGIPVTKIIDNGFKNKTNLTQITLPNSIEIIGRHAFEGCTSLSSITIPDSVTTIGAYSFYKSGVTEVNLSEIDKWVCDKDGMSYHNFTYSSTGFGAGTDVSVYENYVSIDLSNPNKIAKALSEPLNVAWKTSNMSGSFKTELRYIYLYSVDWTKNY